jgi:hypothetical protein
MPLRTLFAKPGRGEHADNYNVGFGSKADIAATTANIRFAPKGDRNCVAAK